MLHGHLTGLKPSQIKALERIAQRRVPPGRVVTVELARYLCERPHEIHRQLGIIVDRQGAVRHVIVGDDRQIVIPDLSGYGLGRSRLKGDQGQQIWAGWSILAYNLDTLAIRTR